MMTRRALLAGGAALAVSGIGLAQPAGSLNLALLNARVWTGDGRRPYTDAIGIAGERIALLGAARVRAAITPATRVVDLQGAFVLPGFTDCHTHFLRGAAALRQPSLRDARTPQAFVARIAEAARGLERGEWIQGGHWDEQLWGGELPTRQWIDAVTPAHPVAVARSDLHMLLLNSLALRLAGITRDMPDPPGGRILRDGAGEPTGIVVDNARAPVLAVIPPPNEAQVERTLRDGIAYALSKGVTHVHNTEVDWTTQDALRRLRRQGETGLRFLSFVPLRDWERMAALVRAEGRGDDWVRWGTVKGVADGSLGSRTALFHEPYTDAPTQNGVRTLSAADLSGWVSAADAHALQVSIHAIGDAMNDEVLDMFAEVARRNGPRDRRFRIEHAQHLSPGAIPRFARQGVIASMQPYHAIDDGRWAVRRIGEERLQRTYAFRSLLDSGARVAFGSDWPVAPVDPMTGVAAAVLRQTTDGLNPQGWHPEQRLSIEQALHAYTSTAAYAGFQEHQAGRIAPGYLADLAVLDRDLLRSPAGEIADTTVLRTFVAGRERYAAPGA